ncbi:MAG: S41 family peptidase [Patescibacteria group bacterium]|nr:S41 family peptidase [Patescibacteria group bacterium]MDE2437868.1 S41 family peptidase [Patescibacteria group bacterium]
MNLTTRNTLKILIVIGLFFLVGIGGFVLGRLSAPSFSFTESIPPNIEQGSHVPNVNFSIFWETWDAVKTLYLSKNNLNNQDMVYGAIKGMVNSLGDPYTEFFTPQENQAFQEDVGGSFGGIGAEIGFQEGYLAIVAPLKGSPAEHAGLESGDKILKIDNTIVTKDLSLDAAISMIRGKVGSTVIFSILKKGTRTPKEISVKREEITLPTAELEMLPGGIAHVKLYNFNALAESKINQIIVNSLRQGARGYILDMRNNPGGFLDVGIDIASHFVAPGAIIVKEENANNETEIHRAPLGGDAILQHTPIVLLVNGGSASASEIVTGALRDDRGAKVVGTKTFGKGLVQELRNLSDGSSIKVTVAKWLTPHGTSLANGGLIPDYTVNLSEDDVAHGRDPQLQKAIEILQQQLTSTQ